MSSFDWDFVKGVGVLFAPLGVVIVFAGYDSYTTRHDITPGHTVIARTQGEIVTSGPKDKMRGKILMVENNSVYVEIETIEIRKFKLEDVTRE